MKEDVQLSYKQQSPNSYSCDILAGEIYKNKVQRINSIAQNPGLSKHDGDVNDQTEKPLSMSKSNI